MVSMHEWLIQYIVVWCRDGFFRSGLGPLNKWLGNKLCTSPIICSSLTTVINFFFNFHAPWAQSSSFENPVSPIRVPFFIAPSMYKFHHKMLPVPFGIRHQLENVSCRRGALWSYSVPCIVLLRALRMHWRPECGNDCSCAERSFCNAKCSM